MNDTDDAKLESKTGNVPKHSKTIDVEDFECTLCLKLFYQPISLLCGA